MVGVAFICCTFVAKIKCQDIEITKLYSACVKRAILVQFGSSNCMKIKQMSQFYGL